MKDSVGSEKKHTEIAAIDEAVVPANFARFVHSKRDTCEAYRTAL